MILSPEAQTDLYRCVVNHPHFEKFPQIFHRKLGFLLFEGTPEQRATALRVLSNCDDMESARRKAQLTKEQAVVDDDGDYSATDPRSFAELKLAGSVAALGSSGPQM